MFEFSDPLPVVQKPEVSRKPLQISDSPDIKRLASALDAIPNEGTKELSYDEWFRIICAIHHATDGSDDGLALAHAFSGRAGKYDPEFLDGRVWPYVRSDRQGSVVTSASLFSAAARAGWVDPQVADAFDVLPASGGHDAGVSPQPSQYHLVRAAELANRPPIKWHIRHVLPQADVIVLFGESGSGKSFVALDLALSVAMGAPWRANRTTQGSVLYIAAEGQGGYAARLRALAKHHGLDLDSVPIDFLPAAPNVLHQPDMQALYDLLRGHRYDLVIFDTLAQVTSGANENSGEDMGRALTNCRKLGQHVGGTVMLVHHAGKDTSKGARGWSGIKAAADAEIEVTRDEAIRCIKVTKLKDGGDGGEYPFKLQQVDLGRDDEGEPVSSCVIQHLTEDQAPRKRKLPKGSVQREALRVIHDIAALADGEVGVAEVIDLVIPTMPHDEGTRDARRHNALRAIKGLADDGYITIRDGEIALRN